MYPSTVSDQHSFQPFFRRNGNHMVPSGDRRSQWPTKRCGFELDPPSTASWQSYALSLMIGDSKLHMYYGYATCSKLHVSCPCIGQGNDRPTLALAGNVHCFPAVSLEPRFDWLWHALSNAYWKYQLSTTLSPSPLPKGPDFCWHFSLTPECRTLTKDPAGPPRISSSSRTNPRALVRSTFINTDLRLLLPTLPLPRLDYKSLPLTPSHHYRLRRRRRSRGRSSTPLVSLLSSACCRRRRGWIPNQVHHLFRF